jgi:hypothetical protein
LMAHAESSELGCPVVLLAALRLAVDRPARTSPRTRRSKMPAVTLCQAGGVVTWLKTVDFRGPQTSVNILKHSTDRFRRFSVLIFERRAARRGRGRGFDVPERRRTSADKFPLRRLEGSSPM